MSWRDVLLLALSALRSSLTRTLLTLLGLGVGAGAVLTVLTLGDAGQLRVEEEIARLGVDKVWISAMEEEHPLTADCAATLRSEMASPACAAASTMGLVTLGETVAPAQLAGYDTDLQRVHHPVAVQGRLLTKREYREGRAVCLVDETLAEALGGNVVGTRVMAGNRLLYVAGVVTGMPMQAMTVGGGLLVMPLATFTDTFSLPVAEVTLPVAPGSSPDALAEQAVAVLGGGYRATTLENEIDAARQVIRVFVAVLACVAAVCAVTGAIGVMNVLLISVRERRQEIGLLKALGATRGQVAALFLSEAALYALFGGLLGTALGAMLIRACGGWIGLNAGLTWQTALPVLAGCGMLGLLFGVAPALRAAGLQPVDALREE